MASITNYDLILIPYYYPYFMHNPTKFNSIRLQVSANTTENHVLVRKGGRTSGRCYYVESLE